MRRIALVLAAALVVGWSIAACSPPGTGMVVGDSLVQNVKTFGHDNDPGVPMHGYPGWSPCDYGFSPYMWSDWNTKPRPVTVVLAWTGNYGACVHTSGDQMADDASLVVAYRTELTREAGWYLRNGTRHVVVEAPPCRPPGVVTVADDLSAMEALVAWQSNGTITWRTTARDAVCPGGIYHPELRAADGNHLSDKGAELYGRALQKDAGAK